MPEAETQTPFTDNLIGWAILAGIALIIWWLLPDRITDPWRYSIQYHTDTDQVFYEGKPHDCDYDKAPFGNKECHFEKSVSVFKNDKGVNQVYISWQKVQE
jgi:hypothetical protein